MTGKRLTSDQVLTTLVETPGRFAALTEALDPDQLRTAPVPGEWSANDVLAHLRCCADVWGSYIARILAEEKPSIRAVSPRTWIKRTDYPEQEFRPSLQAFISQRVELLAVLAPLPPEDWSRVATVTGSGKPADRTVLNFAERMARHERSHFSQIRNIVDVIQAESSV